MDLGVLAIREQEGEAERRALEAAGGPRLARVTEIGAIPFK